MNNPQNGWTRERAHHRFCLRHICSNFNMRFGSKELKDMVYLAGAQHQPRKFKAVMTELQEMNAECIAWFNDLDRAQWTNAYDKGYRYGWMTTNLAECFNGVLKGVRFYPITALVQVTFYRVLEFFNKRRDEIGANF
ncbi:hypothetical protein Scep_011212 [Stephania cephalantha]|uniref:Transposase n=1 Tax=Stephania cephalantha TaxID=152367 RepID=A0AAP0JCS7_9MAGN